jgi:hypothetical protein
MTSWPTSFSFSFALPFSLLDLGVGLLFLIRIVAVATLLKSPRRDRSSE